MEIKEKVMGGLFWRFSERFLAQVISFVVSMVLARLLSPGEYGMVSVVMIFITIANVLVINGLGTSLVQKKEADDLDFSTITIAGLGLSLMLYSIIFFAAPFLGRLYGDNGLTAVLRIMGLRIPIASFNSVQQAFVQKYMMFKKFFYSTLFGTLISGIAGILMAVNGYGVWSLVGQYLINSSVDTSVLFFTIGWKPKWSFSYTRFRALFSYGWKVMCASLIGTLFEQLKSFVIGIKYTSESLAYFNRGEQIPALIANNISSTVESVIFPAMAQRQDDPDMMRNMLKRCMKIISYVLMPVMFLIAATADTLVMVLLTDKWKPCIPYIQILCIQYCFNVISMINLQFFKAAGRSDISLKLEFVKKPIFLICIFVGMQIGPLAIAVSMTFYSILVIIFNAHPSKTIINYGVLDQIKDISFNFFISFGMAAIVILVGRIPMLGIVRLSVQIITGIVIYLGLSLMLKIDSFEYMLNLFIMIGKPASQKDIMEDRYK